jgi:hypothetical protein
MVIDAFLELMQDRHAQGRSQLHLEVADRVGTGGRIEGVHRHRQSPGSFDIVSLQPSSAQAERLLQR